MWDKSLHGFCLWLQAGHGHDGARVDHDEARAGRDLRIGDRDREILGAAGMFGVPSVSERGVLAMQTGRLP